LRQVLDGSAVRFEFGDLLRQRVVDRLLVAERVLGAGRAVEAGAHGVFLRAEAASSVRVAQGGLIMLNRHDAAAGTADLSR
jgi:hypothetical protein